MKGLKFLSILILVPVLLLAGCAPTLSFGGAAHNVLTLPGILATATPAADVPVSGAEAVNAPVASNAMLAAYQGTLEDIYAQVNPSVVNIDVVMGGADTSFSQRGNPFGVPQQAPSGEALGSGFVWDSQGHIVTNNHVVEGATKITVNFSDGTVLDAKLVGADPNADLAVIKVNAPDGLLHPVAVGDSTKVKVGQLAIAIGNPYGLSGTMTEGIISALSRSLPVGAATAAGGTYTIPDIIQTDAAINPGNSGGVLVNDQGQVIGVTAAIRSATDSNSGIGFVIPSAIVKRVVPGLIKDGSYSHPYMGISGTSLTADLNAQLNLNAAQKGILVVDVSSGSPAEQAGLRGSTIQSTNAGQQVPSGGDIITAVDGHAVSSIGDLTSYLFNNTQTGQTVNLTVLRQGKETTVTLTLGKMPVAQTQQ